jgi:MurNAc alpha-1-phosphate uridylyltransferase
VSEPLPTVCILAGGVGSRLGAQVRDTPKPLLEVAGEPFILHQLRLLARNGARRAVICVGYLGGELMERVGERQFGLKISYSDDGPALLGTLGAVRNALPSLGSRFLVLYGDTYLRIDYRMAAAAWADSGLPAMMTVLRNEGRWDVSNVEFDGEHVICYDKRHPSPGMEWIDYGLGALTADALDVVDQEVSDLADLYAELARRNELFGFAANERFYEIGTPESLAETAAFLAGGAGGAL